MTLFCHDYDWCFNVKRNIRKERADSRKNREILEAELNQKRVGCRSNTQPIRKAQQGQSTYYLEKGDRLMKKKQVQKVSRSARSRINQRFGATTAHAHISRNQFGTNVIMKHSTKPPTKSENVYVNTKVVSAPIQESGKEEPNCRLPIGGNDSAQIKQNRTKDIFIRTTLEEAFTPPQNKPRRKCTHDGRLLIRDETVFQAIKGCCNTKKPIEGGVGTVYISENQIHRLNIKVALKELRCDNTQREHSIENEKVASRIMHFAIVPLLAMGSDTAKRTHWFLYPRLVRGDLYTLIETDTRCITNKKIADVELDRNRRLRIIFHVSAAIDFLHTEIKKMRGAILHLDVKTRNIVLDQFYNARLADFGVARETSGSKTSIHTSVASMPCTHGYFEPKSDTLDKSFDYYNFGVVIREMLTGKPPVFKYSDTLEDEYLRNMDDNLLEFYIKLQGRIWHADGKICKVARTLLELSRKCMNSATEREINKSGEKFTSTHIVKEMEGVIRTFCDGNTWERLPLREQTSEDDNCEMCMINPAVAEDLIVHASNCRSPLKVCLSCMRNSYLNPLRCHSCFQEIEPVIGSNYGAVLVAGHYDDDTKFSYSCARDVADMQNVFTSKCPLVIGIREVFVKTITQCHKGTVTEQKDNVSSQIRNELLALKRRGKKTILFYYSGHYAKDDGFILRKGHGVNENMPLSDFVDMLKAVFTVDKSKSVKIIVILDCCAAPIFATSQSGFHDNMYLNIVQLNACRPHEAALQEQDWIGSIFKELFIQALTMKSTESDCILQRIDQTCNICPIMDDDYITIGSLNTYIGRHINKLQKHRGSVLSLPVQCAATDVIIAYVVESSAKLDFTLRFDDRKGYCSINCKFFTNICQLKNELFNEFMEKMRGDKEKNNNSHLELKAETYKDILRIVIQKGPRDKHRHELCTLEQVMWAWNGKRELSVELRNSVLIKDGMVGVFMDGIGKLLPYLYIHKLRRKEEETIYLFTFDVDEVMSKGLKIYDNVLQDLQRGLLEFRKEHRQGAELHIISPCMIDENGVRHIREDFVCFNIHNKR